MRKEIADLVYPILTHALRVKEQLSQGDELSFQAEQSKLKGMLKSEAEARKWPEFVGERDSSGSFSGRMAGETFLGIRYALVCWLDEIFILDSPWKEQWTENSLEVGLYGTRDRAERFWEQARKAEARPESDALEVFFLCAMLGFRGDLRDKPERLKSWREAAHAQIARSQTSGWKEPPAPDPVIDVPPLHGAQRFHRMVVALGLSVLLVIPAAVFYLVLQLR
jgi:type VI secretion system protein ImpK